MTPGARPALPSSSIRRQLLRLARRRPLVCATIFAINKREFLEDLEKAAALGSDVAELRIDALEDVNQKTIKQIISESQLPLIVTNRDESDGGHFPLNQEKARLSFLLTAIRCSPAFVDIELSASAKGRDGVVHAARANGVGVICSFHDFKGTPTTERMLELYEEASATRPDIVKLVFAPHSNKDVLRILQASEMLGSAKTPYTVFGVGESGKLTRVLGPALGSCLAYCSPGGSSTKLGQLSVKETRSFFDTLASEKGWRSVRRDRTHVLEVATREVLARRERGLLLDPSKLLRA